MQGALAGHDANAAGVRPEGPGLRNKDIETAAGFALSLPRQDGWLTWSLLMALVRDKKIQFTTRGKRGIRYFRLK